MLPQISSLHSFHACLHRFCFGWLSSTFIYLHIFSLVSAGKVLALELVVEKQGVAKIFVSPEDLNARNGGESLRLALEDFNYHLEKMSGSRLEVVETREPKEVGGAALIIGSLAVAQGTRAPSTKWKEGYRIRIGESQGFVSGETPQATSYGLYALLRRLGCDWVMPGPLGEIIPARKRVVLEQGDDAESPSFGRRSFWLGGGPSIVTKAEREFYNQWARRMRLGIAEELLLDGQGHFWDSLIAKNKEAFENEPEMLALVTDPAGKLVRKGPQIETTHPGILDLLERHVRETFEKNQWSKEKAVTLPMGPADGVGYSLSPKSIGITGGRRDPISGGPEVTSLVVSLINALLERVGEEFPHLSFGYYVYSVHADFPADVRPHPRIYPTLAPIAYSRLHATGDPYSKSRSFYKGIVDQWAAHSKETGARLHVYEYNWNLADNMLPFTKVEMLAKDVKFYHERGFEGFTLESSKAWAVTGVGDYIAARLIWNAAEDWREILAEYCQKAFGSAATEIENYYIRLAKVQRMAGQEAGSYHSAPFVFDSEYLAVAEVDLNAAKKHDLAPEQRLRLEGVTAPHGILKSYLAWFQAMNAFDFTSAQKHYSDILTTWQETLGKNSFFVCRYAPRYMESQIAMSMNEGVRYSNGSYQIVHRIPDELPTALDPQNIGKRLNLFGPEINDTLWIRTHTYGSTWDAQGLGFYREGSVWYRTRFQAPNASEKEPVGLFLGGFEDVAEVWLNGKPIGRSGVQFLKPAVFDLTDHIRYGEENLLAIQVSTFMGHINELYLGGLLRPSFIFKGPRVVTSDNPKDAEYRVLPGAGQEVD